MFKTEKKNTRFSLAKSNILIINDDTNNKSYTNFPFFANFVAREKRIHGEIGHFVKNIGCVLKISLFPYRFCKPAVHICKHTL